MASFTSSVRIERPAEEVFAYATDPTRFSEWQASATSGHVVGEPKVGATCVHVRRVPGGQREAKSEITEYMPPTRWAVRGVDGPIRANVGVTVEALEPGASRVTIELEFVGVGVMGLALAPVVGWRGRQEMPGNMANLKRLLEGDHDSLSGET